MNLIITFFVSATISGALAIPSKKSVPDAKPNPVKPEAKSVSKMENKMLPPQMEKKQLLFDDYTSYEEETYMLVPIPGNYKGVDWTCVTEALTKVVTCVLLETADFKESSEYGADHMPNLRVDYLKCFLTLVNDLIPCFKKGDSEEHMHSDSNESEESKGSVFVPLRGESPRKL